jgi:hypothetical protein
MNSYHEWYWGSEFDTQKGTCNTSDGPASHVKTHRTVRSSTGAQSPQHMPQTSPIAWPAMTYDPTDLAYARNRCFVSTINHIRSKQMFQSQKHIRSIRWNHTIHHQSEAQRFTGISPTHMLLRSTLPSHHYDAPPSSYTLTVRIHQGDESWGREERKS